MAKRIKWLDTAKGLGIILVVLGHISKNQIAIKYIFSFHIPLFFFISGYLFNSTKYNNFKYFIEKKTRSLIIPYFSFSFISYFYWLLSSSMGKIKGLGMPLYKPLVGIFYSNGIYGWPIYNGALWFLTCLFVTEILFYFLFKYSKKPIILGVFLFFASIIGYLGSLFLHVNLPWGINTAFIAIVFYGSGFIVKQFKPAILSFVKSKKVLILLSALIVNIIFGFLNKRIDMAPNHYGNYFYFYLSAFSGIIFYILISKKIDKIRFIDYLGRNSIIILGIHMITNIFAVKTLLSVVKLSEESLRYSLGWSISLTLISLVFIVPVIFLINKLFPFIAGRRTLKNRIGGFYGESQTIP